MTLLHFVLALLLASIVAADECTDLNVTACAALQSKGCDFCHSGGSCDFCGACFNITTSTCCSPGGCEFVDVCTSGSSCCWPEGGDCYHYGPLCCPETTSCCANKQREPLCCNSTFTCCNSWGSTACCSDDEVCCPGMFSKCCGKGGVCCQDDDDFAYCCEKGQQCGKQGTPAGGHCVAAQSLPTSKKET